MRTRLFPALRRPVSEIGLGCWQLGADWGEVDDAQAMKILRAANEQGITFFDTADVYGSGRSEILVGRFLKTLSTVPFVATKIGRFRDASGADNLRPEVMRAHVEASLRRLGVHAIDLVQLHCVPHAAMRDGAVFDVLARLRDEGKIRSYGASVETIEEAKTCLEKGVHSLQIIFNLFRQDAAESLLEAARQRRVAIIARLPLASGVLSGRYSQSTTFAPDDHRTYNRDGEAFNIGETFSGVPFELAVEFAEELADMGPRAFSLAELAQRWILDHDAVTTVITGATQPSQVFENAGVSDLPSLDEGLHEQFREFYQEVIRPTVRGTI